MKTIFEWDPKKYRNNNSSTANVAKVANLLAATEDTYANPVRMHANLVQFESKPEIDLQEIRNDSHVISITNIKRINTISMIRNISNTDVIREDDSSWDIKHEAALPADFPFEENINIWPSTKEILLRNWNAWDSPQKTKFCNEIRRIQQMTGYSQGNAIAFVLIQNQN